MRFIVEPGMGLSYALGMEAAAPRFFSRRLSTGATVYDVGANKGQMSLIFAALIGRSGRVIAFEPAPPEHASLQRNLRLNHLDYVRTVQAAASDSSGELTFAYARERPTEGKVVGVETSYAAPAASHIRVSSVSLDSMLGDEPAPDMIKIDVEGAAAAVLRGARRIIDEAGPGVYLELHGPEEQAAVRDELMARGYIAETVNGERVADPTLDWHSPLWCYMPRSSKGSS